MTGIVGLGLRASEFAVRLRPGRDPAGPSLPRHLLLATTYHLSLLTACLEGRIWVQSKAYYNGISVPEKVDAICHHDS